MGVSMIVVLIRRCVKADRETDFIKSYNREKPTHPGFIDETLTKLDSSKDLPEPMRSLSMGCPLGCITYLNIARWRSAKDFEEAFKPRTMHDPETECSDRQRAVFDIVNL
jgi:hypothetical protein